MFILQFLFFWPHHTACGIPVPWPGAEPGPPAVKAQSNNHWTAREFPTIFLNATEDNDNKNQSYWGMRVGAGSLLSKSGFWYLHWNLKDSGSHPRKDGVIRFPKRALYCEGSGSTEKHIRSRREQCVWSGKRSKWDWGAGRSKTVMACQAMLMVLSSQWEVISRRVMQVGLHCKRMTLASVWGPKWRRQY